MTLATRALIRKTVLSLACLAIGVTYLFPYIWMVLTGFRSAADTLAIRFIFTPTLAGFGGVLGDSGFQGHVLNSIVVALTTTGTVLTVAVPAGYALAHLPIRGAAFLVAVLVARMVPGIAILIPIYLAASRLGVLDTHGVLILLYSTFNLPFAIWLLRGFFRDVPGEIREAAIIDGCSDRQVLTMIMMPLTTSGIVATGVFVFIAAWNEFLFALVLTRTEVATYTVQVTHYFGGQSGFWAKISAMSVLGTLPIFVVVAFMQRYLVRGISLGAVKG